MNMTDKEKIMHLIKVDTEERNLLIQHGHFSKVSHVLDSFTEGKRIAYLVQSEIFRNVIGLYYVNADDLDNVHVRWVPIYATKCQYMCGNCGNITDYRFIICPKCGADEENCY